VISLNRLLGKSAWYHTDVVPEKKPIMREKQRQNLTGDTMRQTRFLKQCQVALFSWWKVFGLWSAIVVGSVGICEAAILNQANFENGDRAPWGIFVTPNGTMGGAELPTIVIFDTVQEGQESKSLKFKVGQVQYDPEKTIDQGGGLVIQMATDGGMLYLSAHVAVSYHSPKDKRNLAGGMFEWVVDNHVIASHDVGPIENGGTLRQHLKAHHQVKAGLHTIRLRITRPFASKPGQHAPFQFVDDLLIRHLPNL